MSADAKQAYYSEKSPARKSLTLYWITGGLITLAAIGCIVYTNAEISKAKADQAPVVRITRKAPPGTEAATTSSAGMKKAGLENTATPQVGKASGDDGAPKPPSTSENPDDLENQ